MKIIVYKLPLEGKLVCVIVNLNVNVILTRVSYLQVQKKKKNEWCFFPVRIHNTKANSMTLMHRQKSLYTAFRKYSDHRQFLYFHGFVSLS